MNTPNIYKKRPTKQYECVENDKHTFCEDHWYVGGMREIKYNGRHREEVGNQQPLSDTI